MSSRTRPQDPTTQDPTTQDPTKQDDQATAADGPADAPSADTCNVDECTKPSRNRGLCDGHWASRRGDATPRSAEDRDE